MKKNLIILIFSLFFVTTYILAQEIITPTPDINIKTEIKEKRKILRNKIKELRKESKEEIKEIKGAITVPPKIRLCIAQNIRNLNKDIQKQRRELASNYREKLKSVTTDEERENLRKEYLSQLRNINGKFNEGVRKIRLTCRREIGSPTSTPSTSTTSTENTTESKVVIKVTDDGFEPNIVRIEKGGKVEWINDSSKPVWPASDIHPTHKLYPNSSIEKCGTDEEKNIFDACRGIEPNEKWSFTFNEVGEWSYHDHLNPSLTGKVIVK